MEEVKEFTENLIIGLVKNPDIVKVQDFEDEDGTIMLDIIVHHDDMTSIIGKGGNTIKAIRTLVQACAYKKKINRVRVNVDSI